MLLKELILEDVEHFSNVEVVIPSTPPEIGAALLADVLAHSSPS